MLAPLPTVSLRKANTNAFGMVAPRRLSMIALGIATTSALTVRVHCACITGAGAAAVAGAVVAPGAVVVVAGGVVAAGGVVVAAGASGFTEAVSFLADSVASVPVSSLAGAPTLGAGAELGVVNSATGLFTAAAGVCAPMLIA